MIEIAVVICTYNRSSVVFEAIESVLRQAKGTDSFEVIVVDNGSTDNTAELIEARYSDERQVRLIREPNLGLSRARNAGLERAQGRFVAYLDDDAVAGEGWLAQLPKAFDAGGPTVACVAGRVEPAWEAPRPSWLHNELVGYLSVLHYATIPTLMVGEQGPVGANMAFRTETLRRLGGFSTELGRIGTSSLLSNEEISIHRRLKAENLLTIYEPKFCATHLISALRLKKAWFRKRVYWQGISEAIMNIQNSRSSVYTRAHGILRSVAALGARPQHLWALRSNSGDDPEAFLRECRAIRQLGRIRAYSVGVPAQ